MGRELVQYGTIIGEEAMKQENSRRIDYKYESPLFYFIFYFIHFLLYTFFFPRAKSQLEFTSEREQLVGRWNCKISLMASQPIMTQSGLSPSRYPTLA